MGRSDELQMKYNAALTDKSDVHTMVGLVMCKKVGENNGSNKFIHN